MKEIKLLRKKAERNKSLLMCRTKISQSNTCIIGVSE